MRLFRLLLLLSMVSPAFAQGEYFTLEDSTKLYVETQGSGQAMVFIPGWTMTHRFFDRQKPFFAKHYQVLTYDPRGQGRSDKTSTGNVYATHAEDLRELVLKKDLKDIILIGWSSGCLAIYEYIRVYGFDRISKLVFIDEPPKWIGDPETEWVYGTFEAYRSSIKGLISTPGDPNGIINWMCKEPMDSLTRAWMHEEILMTPRPIAINLYIDGVICDYTGEVARLDETVPSLFMVSEDGYEKANQWLTIHAPSSQVQHITSHAMFWERAEQFNAMLVDFLAR